MITLNKIKFAESEKEMINSLFEGIATCSGYAKRLKHSIKLFNLQHELIGVINEHGTLVKATLLDNGKYWYTLADIPLIGEYPYDVMFDDIYKLHIKTDIGGRRYYL